MGLSAEAGPEAGIASVRKTGVFRTLRFEVGITIKIEDIPVRKPMSDWVITSEAIRHGFPTPFKTPYATNRGVSLLRANAAATVMQADRWDAGWKMLRAVNTEDANDAAYGFNLVQANEAVLANCQTAAKDRKDQKCLIRLPQN